MKKSQAYLKATFLEAYEEYSDALFRYCFFRIGDRERSLDLVQDIFMKTWDYMTRDDNEISNMRAFLFRTAANIVVDEYRRRRPSDSLDMLEEEIGYEPSAGEPTDEYDKIIDSLDGARAVELVAQIPEPYGQALFMRFVEGLSLSEMADITGESENTLAVRVHRAISKLQKIWNHEQ